MRTKITVVGAGRVGATCAQRIAERDYADVVIVDVIEGRAAAAAADLAHAGAVLGYEPRVTGAAGYEQAAGSEVVVITAGQPPAAATTADELLAANAAAVREVSAELATRSPDAIVIVVTEPVEAMCHVVYDATAFPRERVLGMSGVVDTARLRALLADELGASPQDVDALVLGGHGDALVPLVSRATVAGAPVTGLLDRALLDGVVERTRAGGAGAARMLGAAAPAAAPSAGVLAIVDAIVLDQRRVLPCAARCRGEYGIEELFAGVPVRLGGEGIEEIVELDLTGDERRALHAAAGAVRAQADALARL